MSYKLTLSEMETVIRFDRSSGEASIYTSDPVWIRKLENLIRETPVLDEVKRDDHARWYVCPKTMIKVHKPRVLMEQDREKRAQHAKQHLAQQQAR